MAILPPALRLVPPSGAKDFLRRILFRTLRTAWIGVLLSTNFPTAARAADQWWEQADHPLGEISAWIASEPSGKAARLEAEASDTGLRFVAKSRPLKLTTAQRFGPNTEVLIEFSLRPPAKGPVVLQATVADEGAPGLPVSVSATAAAETVSINAAGVSAAYQPRGVYKRSLSWPEDLRKQIESTMSSLPAVSERRFTLRYALRPRHARIYLNDILIADRDLQPPPAGSNPAPGKKTLPPISIGGLLSLTLNTGVELHSVSTRALGEESKIFEPVRIDHRLNASLLNGKTLSEGSLPRRGEVAVVREKPFIFPTRDPKGNDHVDVGASWMQLCNYEGNTDPHTGPVGGRWAGTLVENPTRIQFRVPKGRYSALHLIAACESTPDKTPVVSVQFYRPTAGAPENFSARVPQFTAKSAEAVPLRVRGNSGEEGNLWMVTVPIDSGALAAFDDLEWYEMELTKEVQLYRAYPDPTFYSAHAAGLASGAHVYAMTLERPALTVDLQPDTPGHLWTVPKTPAYTARLNNLTGKPRTVTLKLTTSSHDGSSRSAQEVQVQLPAAGTTTRLTPKPTRFGYHDVALTVHDGDQAFVERRSLGLLQKDTRDRGDWEPGRGASHGFWNWAGGHHTPSQALQIEIMSRLGAEWVNGTIHGPDDEGRAAAEKFKVRSLVQGGHSHHYTGRVREHLDNPEKASEWLLEMFQKSDTKPSAVEAPDNFSLLAEPSLGQISTGIPPDYYGKEYTFTPGEEQRFQSALNIFKFVAPLAKQFWPGVKCQFPYGDPLYPVYFLRRSQEVRELMDGVNVDIPVFDRPAESQMHQVSIHRCYVLREELKKAGLQNPNLVMVEGPCLPSRPGALSLGEQAENWVRLSLILQAYGIDRQIGGWAFDCGDYWGEQHYGGGVFNGLPHLTPKPAACALATMTRRTNRKNLNQWLPTGSLSAYALQFKHYRTGELTHCFWTVRGTRPVHLRVPAGAKLTLVDSMDNETPLQEKDGVVTFAASPAPCFVEGLKGDPVVTLGGADHSDARPAPLHTKLANLGNGAWKVSPEEDGTYANNSPLQVERFHGAMTARSVEAPAPQGGRALRVHLEKPAKEQKMMPYYSTLAPAQPVRIPGKASHIGLWVHGASDWGRVVYSLRDAKGERWISVGTFSDWNCDDPRALSYFNFDGWRYLRFEMPSHSPYDRYRESGTTWWGHFGKGDGEVDLPLTLEKVFVERRTHAMYVNDPQPASAEDVLFGDLIAEYARPSDQTQEVIRLDRIRMPVPTNLPELGNPIAEMAAKGNGAPVVIERISEPLQDADGTRCFVHFPQVQNATTYEVWASPYADGRGALQVGKGWKAPGQLITGLRAETDFYLFAAYTDAEGKPSLPSAGYKIRLKDVFGMK
jgi:hypothetical protein